MKRIGALPAPLLATATMAVTLLLVSCGPADTGLGGDPCLLQQYQDRGYTITGHVGAAVSTLAGHLAALSSADGSITASPDISETLTDLREFQLDLAAQWSLLQNGAQPPEGRAFLAATKQSIARFDTGAQLLAAAYTDAGTLETRAALLISTRARESMRQGRLLLDQANQDIAGLKTFSTNC